MYKKITRYFFLLILFTGIMVLLVGCDKQKDPRQIQADFDAFTNDIFVQTVQTDTLTLNYSLAVPEEYGIEKPDITLGEFTVDEMKEQISISENYLKRLKAFDYNSLTEDQQLTYDILKNYLELNLTSGDFLYYTECLGPTTGIQAQLPILLAEYNFYTREDIDDYIKLLPCVYGYFEDIAEFEREKSKRGLFMRDEVADSIIDQCKAFIENPKENFLIEYFNEKIDGYEGLSKEEKASYKANNLKAILNYVIPAYQLLIDTLTELKGTGINNAGLYYYPDGQSYYEYLAKVKTGSGRSMEELADLLETAIGDELLQITRIVLAHPDILDRYMEFTSFPITDPEAILDDLKKDIAEDFPEPVPVSCEIKYVDDSLADYLSPAMYLVPAIDEYKDNNIYINGNDEETLARIYTTVAHEGYPGHLYQCVYFRDQNPAPIRNIMDFVGYDEGWATYVEHYSYQLAGIDETMAEFLESNSAAMLFMYARADIGIHYEGWNEKKALAYINSIVGDQDKATSKMIYDTLLEEPAVYLPYAVGFLEINDLKKRAEDSLGSEFDARAFHKFLLDIGPAQFTVIEDYFDRWLQAKAAAIY